MASQDISSSLPIVPPPWSCKCTVYVLPFVASGSKPLPIDKVYAPLEANSEAWISKEKAGAHLGGFGFVQIIRYHETPVGSYDELAILPGYFKGPDGLNIKGKHLRITGIWVSQEATCMNGRKNWNIPKHMAEFKWEPTTSSRLPLKVEVTDPGSKQAFFAATIHPMSYTPAFPYSTAWHDYLGLPTTCLQPPLPTGNPPELEVGTETWMLDKPVLRSKKCRVIWLDMQQPSKVAPNGREQQGVDGSGEAKGGENHWWPGMGRWRLGMSCEDAILELGPPKVLEKL